MSNSAPGVSRAGDADQLLESHKLALGTLYDHLNFWFIKEFTFCC